MTIENPDVPAINKDHAEKHVQRHNMAGFRAPPISTVRVGIIGMKRGVSHMLSLLRLDGVEIRALCDKNPEAIEKALNWLKDSDHKPEIYTEGDDEWKKLCEQSDLDLIIVCSPIPLHAEMSIYAMKQGKHVCSEVESAWRMEDCWELVKTAESTRKHFMMMENYCYFDFHLCTINMAYKGFFGDIIHAEGAYNTSKENNAFGKEFYSDMWWLYEYASRRGNIYPSHGLGPVSVCLSINRGDRLDYLVSMESNDFNYDARARKEAEKDSFYEEFVGLPYRGNMNATLIRTVKGRTMMIQHDPHSPSPHNVIHGIYGTKGAALYDPNPSRFSKGDGRWYCKDGKGSDEYARLFEEYTPEICRQTAECSDSEGHSGADLRMMWHIIDCLHNGLPMPQDLYDAVTWSSIVSLTSWSVQHRSNSIDIPDFTCGKWETNARNMDINLENGGGNTKILPLPKGAEEYRDRLTEQWKKDHEGV